MISHFLYLRLFFRSICPNLHTLKCRFHECRLVVWVLPIATFSKGSRHTRDICPYSVGTNVPV